MIFGVSFNFGTVTAYSDFSTVSTLLPGNIHFPLILYFSAASFCDMPVYLPQSRSRKILLGTMGSWSQSAMICAESSARFKSLDTMHLNATFAVANCSAVFWICFFPSSVNVPDMCPCKILLLFSSVCPCLTI